MAKKRTNGVVFLAWGNPAAKRVAKLDKVRHCVLQSVHPSPLSAARGFVSACSRSVSEPKIANDLFSLIVGIFRKPTRG